ncbi:MAG: TonB-dependent receptor plug domain-containing protein, partial [Gammaproteobacteria bacterium]|nr:TonB-dependent receptor plug domain-containing protein [Gammaproteobacteria bacterium]
MRFNHTRVNQAVRSALTAGVATAVTGLPVLFAAPAIAQDTAKEEKGEVTGSRLRGIDVEGANPVTSFDRATLDASGEIAVSDFLRDMTYNSFGSFRERSGSSGGVVSNSLVDLRGLGSQRTLVLIDGRRMVGTAAQFTTGPMYNLNLVPMAAVERIEVLRDGASAVYGSDAIGGVVNIITRKDMEGV